MSFSVNQQLYWTAADETADFFYITINGEVEVAPAVSPQTLTFTAPGLYIIEVRAVNDDGTSSPGRCRYRFYNNGKRVKVL